MLKICMGKIKRDGYTFHSFLQSDGNAYIDTGVYSYGNQKIDVKFQISSIEQTSSDYWCAVYGSKWSNGVGLTLNVKNKKLSLIYGGYTDINCDIDLDIHTFQQSANQFYLDESLIYTTLSKSVAQSKIHLFQRSQSPTIPCKCKVFYFKIGNIYDDDLTINLIPASRDSDGACGMYDLITDTFLTNANTVGTFTVGEEKDFYEWKEIKEIKRLKTPRLPKEYQEVEYIESTGTQWIDTGIVLPNDGYTVKTKMSKVRSVGSWNVYFGASDGGGIFSLHDSSNIIYSNINKRPNYSLGLLASILNNPTSIKVKNEVNKVLFEIGDNTVVYESPIAVPTSSIHLFTWIERGAYTWGSAIRIYNDEGFVIEDANSIALINYIPCYRKSDGEVGMYDIVNNVFHTNQGTGTFLKGEDVKFDTIKKINKVIEGEIKTIYLNG